MNIPNDVLAIKHCLLLIDVCGPYIFFLFPNCYQCHPSCRGDIDNPWYICFYQF